MLQLCYGPWLAPVWFSRSLRAMLSSCVVKVDVRLAEIPSSHRQRSHNPKVHIPRRSSQSAHPSMHVPKHASQGVRPKAYIPRCPSWRTHPYMHVPKHASQSAHPKAPIPKYASQSAHLKMHVQKCPSQSAHPLSSVEAGMSRAGLEVSRGGGTPKRSEKRRLFQCACSPFICLHRWALTLSLWAVHANPSLKKNKWKRT